MSILNVSLSGLRKLIVGEILHLRHLRHRVMGRTIIIAAALLIFGHSLSELSEVVERFRVSGSVYPFVHPPAWASDGINVLWWIKYNTDQALMVICFIVFTMIAKLCSRRLWIIALIFLSYHIVDWFMLWYDYKQSHVMYWLLIADVIAACVVLVKVKDGSKIKSII